MTKSNKQLIREMKLLEKDHEPEGYPCIKMKDISRLIKIIQVLQEDIIYLKFTRIKL